MARTSQQIRDRSKKKKKKAKRKKWMHKKTTTTSSGTSAHSDSDYWESVSSDESFESAESGESFASAHSGDQSDEGEYEDARATNEKCIICHRDDLNEDIIRPCHCRGENMGHHFSCLINRIVRENDRECLCGQRFEDPRIRRMEAPDLAETMRRYWQFYVVCILAIAMAINILMAGDILPPPLIFIMAYAFIHFSLYVPTVLGLEGESVEFTCQRQDGTEFIYAYNFGAQEGNMELNDVIAAITDYPNCTKV